MVIADGAEHDALLHFAQGHHQPLDINLAHTHDMKREPLRRLLANTRQAFEFVDELRYGFCVFEHEEKAGFGLWFLVFGLRCGCNIEPCRSTVASEVTNGKC